ncbi:LapA family protein [Nitrosomonas eutropha]
MTLVRLIVFLFLLSVAVKNSERVTIHYYLGMEWEVPVVVVLFLCFAAGALFGYLSCLIKKIRRKP